VANPIDESKFGQLSADMLVRKGDAEPSEIRRARRKKGEPPALNVVASNGESAEPQDEPPEDDDSELLPPFGVFEHTVSQTAPKKRHRVVIALSEEEHETLGILAVKKGFTRHQVLRKALDAYFEWLTDEYGPHCRCVASTCSKECDHLSAAEVSERPTDVE
jgi:hypothetical protein